MRIGIELTPLTYRLTGVGYYVSHLIHEMLHVAEEESIRGFVAGFRSMESSLKDFPVKRVPLPQRVLKLLWDRVHAPRVDCLLGGVDVYHAVNYVLPPLKHAKGILSIHDLGFLRQPDWSNPATRAPFAATIHKDALRADAIIACSESTRDDIVSLLQVPPERVHVIYDAADASFVPVARSTAQERVAAALGLEAPYLLFVSTLEARKNILTLLEAFARTSVPHRLVLAGGAGWGSASILERAKKADLSERVLLTGYIPDRSLFPSLYSAADAFVFPSWYEGFGLALLEAMACGCPVITSNSSSLPEVGGDAPLYVDPGDVDGLAHAIERLCGDKALQEAMREKSIAQSRKFSWRQCAAQTLHCYRSLF
ncbi:MAG: glycosyltransferase family 4 protein [Candidatus Hydrogenedentes bacterium]|nr:glycosyltransferase family 4 protein [Candidatus Hydrogenedentota bacterium]